MIRRCLRLQLRSQLPASLAVLLVFGLGSFLGVALTGRAEGLFYIYYQMYPAMGLFVLFIYGSTNTANLAVSYTLVDKDGKHFEDIFNETVRFVNDSCLAGSNVTCGI